MAVVTTYSTEATNHKSVDNTKNPTTATEGVVKISSATVAIAAGDDDASIFPMLPVHSSWSIKHIWVYNDALTSGNDFNIGLYTTAATPVDVDENCYADAIDLSSARTAVPLECAYEARNITAVNQKVWQDAGATADTNRWYWLTLTSVTIGSAAGDVTFIVHYTD